MRLPRPFYRLPLRLDAARLQAEVDALGDDAWQPHPNLIPGNECVRLISVDGGENDLVDGAMAPTRHLERAPYIRQILGSFGVAWSRSRLMRLAPRARVPEHADINHHWFYRVRMHIPVRTHPDVRFHCGGESVHMAAGEAWIFDNWRLHSVENPSDVSRVHLVADTSGSAAFWNFVRTAETGGVADAPLRFDAGAAGAVRTERAAAAPIMHPSELDLLLFDLMRELDVDAQQSVPRDRLAAYAALLDAFRHDWRQLHAAREDDVDLTAFAALRDALRERSRALADGLVARTNRVAAHVVLEGRVLRALVPQTRAPARARRSLPAPLVILAAPRSGSTLLFETLACSPQFVSVGGEAHEIIEGLPQLRPGAAGVRSNRLQSEHADADTRAALQARFAAALVDHEGRRVTDPGGRTLLEKTPKNALRVPFLREVFPDARFVLLWRDPRENLASIMAAWRSGRWRTYAGLPGRTEPWSLLLPPGWEQLRDAPLEEIAAYQWDAANRTALDDLEHVDPARWLLVRYDELIADPAATVARIARFAGLQFDAALQQRTSQPLPLSKQTLAPPDPGKWQGQRSEIERVLPGLEPTWRRLRSHGP